MILRHSARDVPILDLAWCDSTNRIALEPEELSAALGIPKSRLPEPPYAVVTTDQRGGRGRQGRTWVNRPGRSLAFSLVWRPGAPRELWGWYSLASALATREACQVLVEKTSGAQHVSAPTLEVKWPNDLLLPDGRKVAGILAEVRGDVLVQGIGINLLPATASERTQEGLERAAAVAELSAVHAEAVAGEGGRHQLAHHMATSVACAFAEVEAGARERETLRERYAVNCLTVGARVALDAPNGRHLRGRAVGINDYGHLLVRLDTGVLRTVTAEDVHLVQPRPPSRDVIEEGT